MPIRFMCVYCERKLSIATRKAGSEIACPRCQGRMLVPAADPAALAKLAERREKREKRRKAKLLAPGGNSLPPIEDPSPARTLTPEEIAKRQRRKERRERSERKERKEKQQDRSPASANHPNLTPPVRTSKTISQPTPQPPLVKKSVASTQTNLLFESGDFEKYLEGGTTRLGTTSVPATATPVNQLSTQRNPSNSPLQDIPPAFVESTPKETPESVQLARGVFREVWQEAGPEKPEPKLPRWWVPLVLFLVASVFYAGGFLSAFLLYARKTGGAVVESVVK